MKQIKTKELLHNYDDLNDIDINREVKRAKALIVNSNDEIMLVFSHNTYFLVGGHVEENESYESCLEREILEETGIKITFDSLTPFLSIKYMNKDYPQKGDNSRYITNYYLVETDAQPNLDIINLTDDEKDGNLEIRYIHKDNILEELNSNLKISSEKNAVVVIDTIEAVKCYLEDN